MFNFDPEKFYRPTGPEMQRIASKAQWLYWRQNGRGPVYYKLEHSVLYRGKDLIEWINAARVDPARRKVPPKSPQTVTRNAEIVRRHKDGETAADLAKAFGITPQRVRQILVRAGYAKKRNERNDEVTLVCPYCGNSRIMWASQAKNRQDAFCSAKCRALGDPTHPGRLAYLMRRDEQLVWRAIDQRLSAPNSYTIAKRWASWAGWPWPPEEGVSGSDVAGGRSA